MTCHVSGGLTSFESFDGTVMRPSGAGSLPSDHVSHMAPWWQDVEWRQKNGQGQQGHLMHGVWPFCSETSFKQNCVLHLHWHWCVA